VQDAFSRTHTKMQVTSRGRARGTGGNTGRGTVTGTAWLPPVSQHVIQTDLIIMLCTFAWLERQTRSIIFIKTPQLISSYIRPQFVLRPVSWLELCEPLRWRWRQEGRWTRTSNNIDSTSEHNGAQADDIL